MIRLLAGLVLLGACGVDRQDESTSPDEMSLGEAGFVPGPWAARRLTRDQFVYLVEDVLDVRLSQAEQDALPQEVPTDGFTTHGVALVTTTQHVEAWWTVSEAVVQRADLGGLTTQYAPCRSDETRCIDGFVTELGARLFRRPVRADEQLRYRAVFTAARAESAGFSEAAGWTLQAMLQGPGVLYQLVDRPADSDGLRVLTDHELAARVAMLLRRSAPDASLRLAADAGELHTTAQLAVQVDRLLKDPALQRSSARFGRDWLVLDRLQGLVRADAAPGTADLLREAALRTWSHHVHQKQSAVFDVLDSPTVMVHPGLSEWYGEGAPEGWSVVEVEDPRRTGALTWPGVLAATADRDLGGMVARGLYIREHMRCQTQLHPPEELDLSAFTNHLEPGSTDREYAEDRLARSDCAGCHRQVDPLAFGLEPFDGLGRENATNEVGRELRTDGFVPTSGGDVPYRTPAELGAILGADPLVQRCVTEKHMAYALGRPLHRSDRVAVDEVHAVAMEDGGSFHALMQAIVLHPVFRVIDTEGGE